MSDGWYYARNGKSFGPFPRTQLQQMAATGKIRPTDVFWKDGMKEWKPGDAVKGLFSQPAGWRTGPDMAVDARPASSARPFLTGALCGLCLGLAVGLFGPWAYTLSQAGRDDREPSAAQQEANEAGGKPVKRNPAPRLTSGAKRLP